MAERFGTTTKKGMSFVNTSQGNVRGPIDGNKNTVQSPGDMPRSNGLAQMSQVEGVIKDNLSGPFLGNSSANT